MKNKPIAQNTKRVKRSSGFFLLLLLPALLIGLFWRSFLPDFVHFSNDGPLGMQMAAWLQLPQSFTGSWYDLNSIGSSAGSFAPSITAVIHWILGPVGYAKFIAPIALWILGISAWFFFRQLKLSSLAAILGGLAAALNSTFFSTACWGLASQQIAIGMDFFALGFIVANSPATPALTRWTRLALAGFAVGFNIMDAADIGALMSVFIAAFVFFKTLNEETTSALKKIGKGIGRVAVVALFAGFLATQTVVSLIGSSITGIAGTSQDQETKLQHWDWATQWSLPKMETLGLFVPGLFGYKMDTPKDMMPALQDAYKGGEYWGGGGRDPAIDRYFDSGRQGAQPSGFMRFSGGGNYLGILVALLAAFAVAQSFRRENSVFTGTQRHFIWFWSITVVLSLLLAWGRFSYFYKLFYALPYVSTIRNPAKFIIIFSWATVILFGYGVHALSRRYLEVPAGGANQFSEQLKNWWTKVRGFDRKWTIGCIVAVSGSVLAWLIYAAQKPSLVKFLQSVGFPDEDMAKEIAAFSVGQVGWFILFFTLAAGFCILIISGIFSGRRARLGGILLGALLVLDMGRANLPWIIHWDYIQKYDIDPNSRANSTNPIINFLRDRPYEHRVAILPFRSPEQFQLFDQLYRIEWAQHHFPYYNIQSLDIIQMSRVPADLDAYERALFFRGTPETTYLIPRLWELTNTRYLLGPAGFLDTMNEQLDPGQHRFRIVQRFNIVPKPGIERPVRLEELTATTNLDNGEYALFEFVGALPRVKLYSSWQVTTNDGAALKILADKNFDPYQTVLVSTPLSATSSPTNQNSGSVQFKRYAPKDIVFDAKAGAPAVLLLNDKYDPNWRVTVDGKPAGLLRCNFIMRGVYLEPGAHTVEFKFILPDRPLYVTLTALVTGIFLIGLLIFLQRRKPATTV